MQILVRTFEAGKTVTVDVKASDTIDHVKDKVKSATGILKKNFSLSNRSTPLMLETTVAQAKISKSTTLDMVTRVLGGGKRARGGDAEGGKMSKDERMAEKEKEIKLIELQLQHVDTPIVTVARRNVRQITDAMNPDLLNTCIDALSTDDLRKLHAALSATNNEKVRFDSIGKIIFRASWDGLDDTRTQMDLTEKLIFAASYMLAISGYLGDNGRMNWDMMKAKIFSVFQKKLSDDAVAAVHR